MTTTRTATIEEVIHGIVESMGLGYLHETIYGANVELDKIVRDSQRKPTGAHLPAAVNVLATSGRFDVSSGAYSDLLRESQNVRILFVDKMRFDDRLDQDDTATVESLKGLAREFIKGVRASDLLDYVVTWSWQVRLNAFDSNLAVLELTALLRETRGDCLDG